MSSNRMKVRVLAVGDPAVYGYTDPAEGILTSFTEATGVAVDFNIVAWDDYGPTLFEQAAAEQPDYDIVMIAGHLWLAQFASSGWLAPLDPFASLNDAAGASTDTLAQIAAEMRHEGVQWLVPSFTDGHLLYDRTGDPRLIDSDGLAHPRVVAQVAADGARFICKASPSEIFLDWLPYLWACGGQWLSDDGEPLFDTSEGIAALQTYMALSAHLSPQDAPWGNGEVADALATGRAHVGISWGGQAGVIVPGAADEPAAGAQGHPFRYATLTDPWNVTWSFGLLARAPHPDEAVELLAHLGGEAADRMIARRAGSPVRATTYDDPDLARACPWLNAQRQLVERARQLPARADLASLMAPMYAELHAAFTGERTAADALARASRAVRDARSV